jgi:hypothetical protein
MPDLMDFPGVHRSRPPSIQFSENFVKEIFFVPSRSKIQPTAPSSNSARQL